MSTTGTDGAAAAAPPPPRTNSTRSVATPRAGEDTSQTQPALSRPASNPQSARGHDSQRSAPAFASATPGAEGSTAAGAAPRSIASAMSSDAPQPAAASAPGPASAGSVPPPSSMPSAAALVPASGGAEKEVPPTPPRSEAQSPGSPRASTVKTPPRQPTFLSRPSILSRSSGAGPASVVSDRLKPGFYGDLPLGASRSNTPSRTPMDSASLPSGRSSNVRPVTTPRGSSTDVPPMPPRSAQQPGARAADYVLPPPSSHAVPPSRSDLLDAPPAHRSAAAPAPLEHVVPRMLGGPAHNDASQYLQPVGPRPSGVGHAGGVPRGVSAHPTTAPPSGAPGGHVVSKYSGVPGVLFSDPTLPSGLPTPSQFTSLWNDGPPGSPATVTTSGVPPSPPRGGSASGAGTTTASRSTPLQPPAVVRGGAGMRRPSTRHAPTQTSGHLAPQRPPSPSQQGGLPVGVRHSSPHASSSTEVFPPHNARDIFNAMMFPEGGLPPAPLAAAAGLLPADAAHPPQTATAAEFSKYRPGDYITALEEQLRKAADRMGVLCKELYASHEENKTLRARLYAAEDDAARRGNDATALNEQIAGLNDEIQRLQAENQEKVQTEIQLRARCAHSQRLLEGAKHNLARVTAELERYQSEGATEGATSSVSMQAPPSSRVLDDATNQLRLTDCGEHLLPPVIPPRPLWQFLEPVDGVDYTADMTCVTKASEGPAVSLHAEPGVRVDASTINGIATAARGDGEPDGQPSIIARIAFGIGSIGCASALAGARLCVGITGKHGLPRLDLRADGAVFFNGAQVGQERGFGDGALVVLTLERDVEEFRATFAVRDAAAPPVRGVRDADAPRADVTRDDNAQFTASALTASPEEEVFRCSLPLTSLLLVNEGYNSPGAAAASSASLSTVVLHPCVRLASEGACVRVDARLDDAAERYELTRQVWHAENRVRELECVHEHLRANVGAEEEEERRTQRPGDVSTSVSVSAPSQAPVDPAAVRVPSFVSPPRSRQLEGARTPTPVSAVGGSPPQSMPGSPSQRVGSASLARNPAGIAALVCSPGGLLRTVLDAVEADNWQGAHDTIDRFEGVQADRSNAVERHEAASCRELLSQLERRMRGAGPVSLQPCGPPAPPPPRAPAGGGQVAQMVQRFDSNAAVAGGGVPDAAVDVRDDAAADVEPTAVQPPPAMQPFDLGGDDLDPIAAARRFAEALSTAKFNEATYLTALKGGAVPAPAAVEPAAAPPLLPLAAGAATRASESMTSIHTAHTAGSVASGAASTTVMLTASAVEGVGAVLAALAGGQWGAARDELASFFDTAAGAGYLVSHVATNEALARIDDIEHLATARESTPGDARGILRQVFRETSPQRAGRVLCPRAEASFAARVNAILASINEDDWEAAEMSLPGYDTHLRRQHQGGGGGGTPTSARTPRSARQQGGRAVEEFGIGRYLLGRIRERVSAAAPEAAPPAAVMDAPRGHAALAERELHSTPAGVEDALSIVNAVLASVAEGDWAAALDSLPAPVEEAVGTRANHTAAGGPRAVYLPRVPTASKHRPTPAPRTADRAEEGEATLGPYLIAKIRDRMEVASVPPFVNNVLSRLTLEDWERAFDTVPKAGGQHADAAAASDAIPPPRSEEDLAFAHALDVVLMCVLQLKVDVADGADMATSPRGRAAFEATVTSVPPTAGGAQALPPVLLPDGVLRYEKQGGVAVKLLYHLAGGDFAAAEASLDALRAIGTRDLAVRLLSKAKDTLLGPLHAASVLPLLAALSDGDWEGAKTLVNGGAPASGEGAHHVATSNRLAEMLVEKVREMVAAVASAAPARGRRSPARHTQQRLAFHEDVADDGGVGSDGGTSPAASADPHGHVPVEVLRCVVQGDWAGAMAALPAAAYGTADDVRARGYVQKIREKLRRRQAAAVPVAVLQMMSDGEWEAAEASLDGDGVGTPRDGSSPMVSPRSERSGSGSPARSAVSMRLGGIVARIRAQQLAAAEERDSARAALSAARHYQSVVAHALTDILQAMRDGDFAAAAAKCDLPEGVPDGELNHVVGVCRTVMHKLLEKSNDDAVAGYLSALGKGEWHTARALLIPRGNMTPAAVLSGSHLLAQIEAAAKTNMPLPLVRGYVRHVAGALEASIAAYAEGGGDGAGGGDTTLPEPPKELATWIYGTSKDVRDEAMRLDLALASLREGILQRPTDPPGPSPEVLAELANTRAELDDFARVVAVWLDGLYDASGGALATGGASAVAAAASPPPAPPTTHAPPTPPETPPPGAADDWVSKEDQDTVRRVPITKDSVLARLDRLAGQVAGLASAYAVEHAEKTRLGRAIGTFTKVMDAATADDEDAVTTIQLDSDRYDSVPPELLALIPRVLDLSALAYRGEGMQGALITLAETILDRLDGVVAGAAARQPSGGMATPPARSPPRSSSPYHTEPVLPGILPGDERDRLASAVEGVEQRIQRLGVLASTVGAVGAGVSDSDCVSAATSQEGGQAGADEAQALVDALEGIIAAAVDGKQDLNDLLPAQGEGGVDAALADDPLLKLLSRLQPLVDAYKGAPARQRELLAAQAEAELRRKDAARARAEADALRVEQHQAAQDGTHARARSARESKEILTQLACIADTLAGLTPDTHDTRTRGGRGGGKDDASTATVATQPLSDGGATITDALARVSDLATRVVAGCSRVLQDVALQQWKQLADSRDAIVLFDAASAAVNARAAADAADASTGSTLNLSHSWLNDDDLGRPQPAGGTAAAAGDAKATFTALHARDAALRSCFEAMALAKWDDAYAAVAKAFPGKARTYHNFVGRVHDRCKDAAASAVNALLGSVNAGDWDTAYRVLPETMRSAASFHTMKQQLARLQERFAEIAARTAQRIVTALEEGDRAAGDAAVPTKSAGAPESTITAIKDTLARLFTRLAAPSLTSLRDALAREDDGALPPPALASPNTKSPRSVSIVEGGSPRTPRTGRFRTVEAMWDSALSHPRWGRDAAAVLGRAAVDVLTLVLDNMREGDWTRVESVVRSVVDLAGGRGAAPTHDPRQHLAVLRDRWLYSGVDLVEIVLDAVHAGDWEAAYEAVIVHDDQLQSNVPAAATLGYSDPYVDIRGTSPTSSFFGSEMASIASPRRTAAPDGATPTSRSKLLLYQLEERMTLGDHAVQQLKTQPALVDHVARTMDLLASKQGSDTREALDDAKARLPQTLVLPVQRVEAALAGKGSLKATVVEDRGKFRASIQEVERALKTALKVMRGEDVGATPQARRAGSSSSTTGTLPHTLTPLIEDIQSTGRKLRRAARRQTTAANAVAPQSQSHLSTSFSLFLTKAVRALGAAALRRFVARYYSALKSYRRMRRVDRQRMRNLFSTP